MSQGAKGCLVVVVLMAILAVGGLLYFIHAGQGHADTVRAACHRALDERLGQTVTYPYETDPASSASGYGFVGEVDDAASNRYDFQCYESADAQGAVILSIHPHVGRVSHG